MALATSLAMLTALGALASGPIDSARADTVILNRGPQSTNIGVYRPAQSAFIGRAARPGFSDDHYSGFAFIYGRPGDVPVIGDWNGNGTQTQGTFRAGAWRFKNALTGGSGHYSRRYGRLGDRPVVGDWNGDGIQTIGVQRGNLFLLSDSTLSPKTGYQFRYGNPGDIPVVGDWDGDGVDTIGVFRAGTWRLRNSHGTGPPDVTVTFGAAGDWPIVGDWNSDGRVSLGYVRRAGWHLSNSITTPGVNTYVAYGAPTDQPLVGNWGPTSQLFGTTPASLRRFFPIAVDFQPPSLFSTWKSRGINTVIRVPSGTDLEAWTRAANALGLKMIRGPRPNPALDNAEPNLLAFAGPDEPEATGCGHACIGAQYSSLKRAAPSKPYFVNLAGYSVLFTGAPRDVHQCNGPGDSSGGITCLTQYIARTDWVSHDVYPVNSNLPLGMLGTTLDRLRMWSGRRPQFAYIEASDYDQDGSAPSPAQLRGEIWNAIIHGARGISYFVVDATDPTGRPDAVPANLVPEMRAQNARITQLAPVLQSPINPPAVGVKAKGPLEYTWRQVGSTTFIIVLNQSAQFLSSATVKAFGVGVPPLVSVWGEGRARPTLGNGFTDSFGPYAVHVYAF
jgi:hypothetical protein